MPTPNQFDTFMAEVCPYPRSAIRVRIDEVVRRDIRLFVAWRKRRELMDAVRNEIMAMSNPYPEPAQPEPANA